MLKFSVTLLQCSNTLALVCEGEKRGNPIGSTVSSKSTEVNPDKTVFFSNNKNLHIVPVSGDGRFVGSGYIFWRL